MNPKLPVVADWYTWTAIDDAITLIREPYADEWISANTWHLRGRDRDLLIDCALGVAPLRSAVVERFGREPTVVLSHGHLDHMGCAHEFADVWAHELEDVTSPGRGTLSGPELLNLLGAEDSGFDPPGDVMVTALPHVDYDVSGYELRPVTPSRRLRDGDVVDLGDRRLRVLHLPGHTAGSLGLHDAEHRMLFTGDVIYDPPALLDDLHDSDRDDYVRSMRRLLDLEVEVVHTGHGESFDGTRLRELAADYLTG
jgi:glyoxylase-like metal-dependent hydrolase (beta-lactamase superfamily II)